MMVNNAIYFNVSQSRSGVVSGQFSHRNFQSIKGFKSEFIFGKSAAMQEIYELLERAAQSDSSVLITGETGTGKDLIARQLHQMGQRSQEPFVIIDCATIPKELMENELFGHERGAFTGAYRQMKGKIESAEGGTVLFDDINTMTMELQSKLLRVLQERNFERVGGTKTVFTTARFIFATNQDLKVAMKRGTFREDLFYRIHVFPIHLPPLRERTEDILILVKHFLETFSCQQNKQLRIIDPKARKYLLNYSWPGNVRELENEIERIVNMASDDLTTVVAALLSEDILQNYDDITEAHGKGMLVEAVESLEKRMLIDSLRKFHGNKTKAANYLGISRRGINKKLKRYGMTNAEWIRKPA